MSKDFSEETIRYFNDVAKRHANTALRAEWVEERDVLKVLNDIGATPHRNHAFFPSGGGLDLTSARASHERGCVELDLQGLINVAKVQSLQMERFAGDLSGEWTYFRLNLAPLAPSGIYPDLTFPFEELTEVRAGEYDERSLSESPECPPGARVVTRWLKGAFVIFAKGSTYNHTSATYDGRHSLGSLTREGPEVSAEAFRRHIEDVVRSRNSRQ